MEQTDSSDKKKKTRIIIMVIIGFGLSYFATQQIFFKALSSDKILTQAACDLSKVCPIMIDQNIRLDKAIYLDNSIFQNNYTLIHTDKKTVNFDTINKYIEQGINNNVKTNPYLKVCRNKIEIMNYRFKDKNGEFVFRISVPTNLFDKN